MRTLVAAVAMALLLGGCTAVSQPPEPLPTPVGERAVLATGLEVPWDLALLPDRSVLVTLRDRAQLVRIADGAMRLVDQVPGVVPGGEGGLLGLALSPTFAEDQLLYLYYTAATDNRVVRFRYAEHALSDPRTILTGIPKAGNHNGGRIRFGPDGLLYIGTGDSGRSELAQDRGSLGGKILRVTADGGVPPGNPFGTPVYSYGHRNVQGLAWDATGQLWASEFGQSTWDELNRITAGANYGWPQTEGETDVAGVTPPVRIWRTSEASPSGIAIGPDGSVYFAALRGERVWTVPMVAGVAGRPSVLLDGLGRIRAVEVVGDRLYVLTNNTARGTPRPGDDRLVSVPLP